MPVVHEREHRVTTLELFFDLVFVFALTQVTGTLADDPTWGGLGRGLLVLAAVWWAWVGYAWLTNTLDPDEGAVRIAMFVSMAAMLLVALAVPEAFGEHGVLFGIAYAVVRVMHLALYAIGAQGDRGLLRAVVLFAPSSLLGSGLIIAAGFLDGDVRPAFWGAALAIDYLGAIVGRAQGWRVHPGHFAERHGLIVIVALGESIVALGVGAAGQPVDSGVIAASILGMVVAAAIWWAYFDWFDAAAERRLAREEGVARAALARDAYSYFHLPIVAGIVLFALGLKKTLGDVEGDLGTIPAVGMFGGCALYLAAFTAFRLRADRRVSAGRLVLALVLVAAIPLAREAEALTALAGVAALWVALITYELLRYREDRAALRALRQPAD